jgi:hypothetical protein
MLSLRRINLLETRHKIYKCFQYIFAERHKYIFFKYIHMKLRDLELKCTEVGPMPTPRTNQGSRREI